LIFNRFDLLDQQEDGEGDDHESDYRVDEEAVVERGRAGRLGRGEGRVRGALQRDEEVAEVDATEEQADRRHQQIIDQRIDDRRERHPENEADPQVDDIATHREIAKLAPHR
jgi:hypothetical protein